MMHYDSIIIGGGTTGTAAAIAAAKKGCKTLIIEKNYALGGTSTLGQVTPRMSSHVDGFVTESFRAITDAALTYGWAHVSQSGNNRWFSPELMKVTLNRLVRESGAEVLFGGTLIDAETENGKIVKIRVKAIQEIYEFSADTFIDASGDALLAVAAGCKTECGDKDSSNQNITLRFCVSGVDTEKLKDYLRSIGEYVPEDTSFEFAFTWNHTDKKLYEIFTKAVEDGELTHADALYIQAFISPCYGAGFVYFNCPEAPLYNHSTNPFEVSKAVAYCRESAVRLLSFFKKHFGGFENAFISSFAELPGVRDGSRIIGKYQLSNEDYTSSRKFADGIAQCAYPIDIHGAKSLHLKPHKPGDYFEVPFRCMITDNVSNLIVAGRCVSATYTAQSSIRIQQICIAMGEAAGLAAAYAKEHQVPANEIDGAQIRKQMIEYGTTFTTQNQN